MIPTTEQLILTLLGDRPNGAFASDLIHLSNEKLKRGSIYTTLSSMEQAGLVYSEIVVPTDEDALPRTLYRITTGEKK